MVAQVATSAIEEPAPEENIKRIAASLCEYAPSDKSGMEQERATLQNILLHLPQAGREART